eukprot:Seg3053.2 transcript_id=Seg3053.2/GoldUCD/mRNA.D3Y31 product="Serine/threonine-protein kinase 33" protein_id=Seg3053.2/GoldUCD/D3Y31
MSLRRSFKVPQLKRSTSGFPALQNLAFFYWTDLTQNKLIGKGSFGSVESALYKPGDQRERLVVVKKLHDASQACEREFRKEAMLLYDVRGHRNVVEFLAISKPPRYAIMQEYVGFSFQGFGEDKVVNSLRQYLEHADYAYDFDGFEHVNHFIVKDIAEGVNYLHGKDIVHRDLKPSNILVGNMHNWDLDNGSFIERWQRMDEPIVCKLTDFGESRSRLIQTQTLLSSKVTFLDRGSPAFMSPHIILPELRPREASLDDLKAADIWAFGMVMFVLTNPCLSYPYQQQMAEEIDVKPFMSSREVLENFLREKVEPRSSTKYEIQQAIEWDHLTEMHAVCTDFDISKRITTIEEVKKMLEHRSKVVECEVVNLPVSQ